MASFFMDLTVIPTEETPREDISMREIRKKKIIVEKKYEVDKKEVSKNIQKFDQKPRVYTKNPYSYNEVSLKRLQKITPSAEALVSQPLYNAVGKILGLDTAKEWNQNYDKVFKIAEWAKEKTKTEDILKILKYISSQARSVPSMGSRRIDDIYIHIGLTK